MMTTTPKVALVTGAGSGIGRSVALALLREGYSTVLAGRRLDALQETAKMGESSGSPSLVIPTDVGSPEQVKDLFRQTKERFGRLDVLFNNAGSSAGGTLLEDLTYEQWMTVVNANLTGTFLCTQEAFKIMKDQDPQGGRIINNGSISAHDPRPNSAPYTATKHGVTGLTKAANLDGRKYNIAVGQIDIGNAATGLVSGRPAGGSLQPNGQMMVEATMDVEHVAQAILYMCRLPLESNVLFMTVMATKMPFVGRG